MEATQTFSITGVPLPVRVHLEQALSDEELMEFCARNEMLRVEREPNGDLMLMSPTGSGGGSLDAEVTYQLFDWAKRSGNGKVFGPSAGFTLPDGSMRSPDAAFVSWPRWNALSREEQRRFAPVCPEFVIEVRSPSDRMAMLRAKMQQWIDNGTELAWLIDPDARTVEVYRPERAADVIEGGTSVSGEGPVGGFVLETAAIWQD